MVVKIGANYIHTALGYVSEAGNTVITSDPDLATMYGTYQDTTVADSTNPDDYVWESLDSAEVDTNDEDEDEENANGNDERLYRVAETLKNETVQENMVTGTNQGVTGWQSTDTLTAIDCAPETKTVSGVRWDAHVGSSLSRSEPITGDAMPDAVTVSFWWRASAMCGVTVVIGENMADTQYNYDSTTIDEDGNILDLSDAWIRYTSLVNIDAAADSYPVSIHPENAATIDLCDFKVEPGDKSTTWTASAMEALNTAQSAQNKAETAEGAAQAAQEAAGNASKVATNYLGYGESGLVVGNMTTDELGNNVRIGPDGVDIRNGGTVLASYGADTIRIGVDDGAGAASTINMNNGSATLKTVYEQTDFGDGDILEKRFFEMRAKETMAINAPETVDISVKSVLEGDEEASELAQLMLSAQEEFDLTEDGQEISKGTFGSAVLIANDISIVGNGSPYGMDVSIEGRTFVNGEELHPFDSNTYTSFSGGVVSSGTVVVVKKFGWCHIAGAVSLNGPVSDWTTILGSDAIPAPQHGRNIFNTINSWSTAYQRPARVSVAAGGGLRVRYGAAFELNFSFTYPID